MVQGLSIQMKYFVVRRLHCDGSESLVTPGQPLLVTSPVLMKRSQLLRGLDTGWRSSLWNCLWFLLLPAVVTACCCFLGRNFLAKFDRDGSWKLLPSLPSLRSTALLTPASPGGGR